MNSKQLNFFLINEERPAVYDLFNRLGLKYIVYDSADPESLRLESFPYVQRQANDKIHITLEDYQSQIFFRESGRASEYTIDEAKSYVLEFSHGGMDSDNARVLHRGRFYFCTSYYVSNGESVAKSGQFKKWVDKFYKLFKNEFKLERTGKFPAFFSARTLEWMKETGAVVDAPCLTVSY